jgi:Notch-like protein
VDRTDVSYSYDPYLERKKCEENNCAAKKGDNRCDEECNTPFCDFDGYDCRAGINPWKRCNATAVRGNKFCWDVFRDGFCDEACNTEECLFDGRDCDEAVTQCHPSYDVFCADHFANGVCDERCNNAACGWDGLDCETSSVKHEIIPGSLYVVLTMTMEDFDIEMQQRFQRYLTLKLRTNLKIRRNKDGSPMIHPFDPSTMASANYAFNTNIMPMGNLGIVVYLEIDNVKCLADVGEHCFENAEGYANLFGAMMGSEKVADDWGIIQVGASKADEGDDTGKGSGVTTGIVVGVALLVMAIVVIGIMTKGNKRKRATGITWFPEGFSLSAGAALSRSGGKREQGGHGMFASSKYPSTLNVDGNSQESYSDDGYDAQGPTHSKRARHGLEDGSGGSGQTLMSTYEEGSDGRHWTPQHINAADIRHPDMLGVQTPPQGEAAFRGEHPANDVNARGPGGLTPLHVVCKRGDGLDTGDLEAYGEGDVESRANVIR